MNIRIGLCMFALATICFGDIRRPVSAAQGAPVTLDVRTGPSSTVTLQVPADLLKSARAQEFVFDDDGGARFRNVIAGVLLSLSVGIAGIWLVRRKLSRPAQAAVVLTALTLVCSSVTLADLRGGGGRRPRPIPPSASNFPPGTLVKLREVLGAGTLSGKVSIEIVPEGQPIALIVPAQK